MTGRKRTPRQKRSGTKRVIDLMWLTRHRLTVAFLASAVLVSALGFGTWRFLNDSDNFSVKEISVKKGAEEYSLKPGLDLEGLYMGRNIFSINLRQIRAFIEEARPQCKYIEVRRVLPDRIDVIITEREPYAVIDAKPAVVIDREAVVMADNTSVKDLLRIKGVKFFINTPRPGEVLLTRQVEKAFEILNLVEKQRIKEKAPVTFVDVGNINDITMDLSGVTIKLGRSDFTRNIDRLKMVLSDPKVNLKEIAYIDLRFEKIVISPK
ncbi:MAG: FtsQ-type POTRA domain-containing protein [Candidatus Omnitrophica bacterium]|nr:FtsQ-type POTRA domain-containing protein [Candidatus Omnitrophota bacterium]